MRIIDPRIDSGTAFDWGRTSDDYAKYRDILVLYMAWLAFEDKIAGESEKLVLRYSPDWSGKGETVHPIAIPDCYRESWNGRMKACRGIGASLSESEIAVWEKEHLALLNEIAPGEFDVLHYAAIAELKKKS